MDKVNLNCFDSTNAMFLLLVLNLQIQTVPAQRLECICPGFALVQFKSVAEFAHLYDTFPVTQRSCSK